MKKFMAAVIAVAILAGAACASTNGNLPIATALETQLVPVVPTDELTSTATAQPAVVSSPVYQPTEAPTEAPTKASAVASPPPASGCDPASDAPFGIDMYVNVDDPAGLPQMQAAGSRLVTTVLDWSIIEPNAPLNAVSTRHWDSLDIKVQNARAAGMQLLVLLTNNPPWAAALPGGPVTNTQDLVNFVTAAAERYDGVGASDVSGGPVISYWSFYAEPDNDKLGRALLGKGYWGHDAAGYARLLTLLTPAIHAVNPRARVINGGLAYDYFTTEGGPFNRTFLPSLLAALNTYPGGASAYLDAFAFHFYPISTQRWPTIGDKAREIKGILTQYGAGSLPLIVPEMGFWSDPGVGSSESKQAQYLVQMFTTGLAAGIQRLNWFEVFDGGVGTESHGLFQNKDLAQPKPAYTAYATMTAELAGAHYLRDITATGVSGFVFSTCDSPEKLVVWAAQANGSVAVSRSCVRQVDLLGNVVQITDGSAGDLDGVANGQVLVSVAANHLFYLGNCR